MFLQLIEHFHVVLHRSMLLMEHVSPRMYRSHDPPPLFEAEKKGSNRYKTLTLPIHLANTQMIQSTMLMMNNHPGFAHSYLYELYSNDVHRDRHTFSSLDLPTQSMIFIRSSSRNMSSSLWTRLIR